MSQSLIAVSKLIELIVQLVVSLSFTVLIPLFFVLEEDSQHDVNGNPLEQGQASKLTSSRSNQSLSEDRYNRVHYEFEKSSFPSKLEEYSAYMTSGEKEETSSVSTQPGTIDEKKEKRDRRNKKKEGKVCKAENIKGNYCFFY